MRSTSSQLRSKFTAIQQSVSLEPLSERKTDASSEQSELARGGESIEHLI
ncbi:hypothetical protein [Haloarcula marismortui]|nr:hypothetical protein [Haloarcula marismortui]